MNYLLDTCVISEVVKPSPAPQVIEWLEGIEENRLFLSVMTLGELQKGISALPFSKKRYELQAWLDQALAQRFATRLLAINEETALEWEVGS